MKPEAPKWLLVDAEGQSLGRLSAKVASVLRGKHKPSFSPHEIHGDHVVVVNAGKLQFHPTKLYRKKYYKHTGYTGNLKTSTLKEAMEKDPTKVIEKAVKGMLPDNRLRNKMLKRLHVFPESDHTLLAQKPVPLPLS